MRTGMILAVVAACAVAAACSKKSSLYLEPGRAGETTRPASHEPAQPPPSGVQRASQVEAAQR